jgi:hypothetical protein
MNLIPPLISLHTREDVLSARCAGVKLNAIRKISKKTYQYSRVQCLWSIKDSKVQFYAYSSQFRYSSSNDISELEVSAVKSCLLLSNPISLNISLTGSTTSESCAELVAMSAVSSAAVSIIEDFKDNICHFFATSSSNPMHKILIFYTTCRSHISITCVIITCTISAMTI